MELEMINKTYHEFKDLSKTHNWSKTQGEEVTKLKDILISQIQSYKENCTVDLIPRAIAMEACVYYEYARFSTNPNGSPESILQKALTILKDYVHHKECLFIYLRIVYYFGYLLIKLNSLNSALNILEEAEIVYNKIILTKDTTYCTPDDLFSTYPVLKVMNNNFIKIERLMTHNIQMQSYIYNKLGLFDKYAEYYHMVLRRQLEMADGEPASWAMKTARLALHFLTQYKFLEARHHLFAAYDVLKICIENSQKTVTLENRKPSSICLNLHLQLAGLSRIWVKYGLLLFSASKKVLLTKYFNTKGSSHHDIWSMQGDNETETLGEDPLSKDSDKNCNAKPDGDVNGLSTNNLSPALKFPTLNLEEMEKRVTADLLQTTEQAHALFVFTNSWLVQAKNYYYLTQYPIEYVNCVLDLSELYEHLAFFEKDIDRQYNVQKKRADTLEILNLALKETRPQEFGIIAVDVLRELTEVQMDLMALNLRRLWTIDNNLEAEDIARKEKCSLGSKNSLTFQSCDNVPTVNSYVLRKMEAASHVNAKLRRLSEQLSEKAHQNANASKEDVPLNN